MKRGAVLVLLLLLLSAGFFFGIGRAHDAGQIATIVWEKTNVNEGEAYEDLESHRLVFGAELSAQRLWDADGAAEG